MQKVVSLGANCMITMEMRRFYGIETANFFDWWITPANSLVKLIEDDLDGLFSPDNLQLVGDGRSVANLRYGILHHHDFPRDDAADRVIGITEDAIRKNLEKFAYLKNRWDDLANNGGPVLFIRYRWNLDEELLLTGVRPAPATDGKRLIAALDRKFPDLDYQVLLIDIPEVTLRHPRLIHCDTRDFTLPGEHLNAADLNWEHNTRIFSRLFAGIPLRTVESVGPAQQVC